MTGAPPRSRRRSWWAAPILTLLLIACGAVAIGTATKWGYLPVRAFDSGRWKAGTPDGDRLSMVGSLVRGRRLQGLTQAQVFVLLGKPEKSVPFTGWDLNYYLGPDRGPIRIDSEWLAVKFDAGGRVARVAVIED